jgi:hypothetical protein
VRDAFLAGGGEPRVDRECTDTAVTRGRAGVDRVGAHRSEPAQKITVILRRNYGGDANVPPLTVRLLW